MSSIIEGYNYDIFISYRQKDNKGDRWVSEFVDALKTELESTFKEEITLYFDVNLHDGLLETYDVDASLKEKLKCLVFIPIISRTYCDPKSFAWEHEFKEFVELASNDQFGLKVKLPNGNVASRVLPVLIHELDADDKKMVENELGGFLRGIEFIYKSPGINRPLLPKEENPQDNLNHANYRDQINKVANAINDIINAIEQYSQQFEEVQKEDFKPLSVPGNANKTKIIARSAIALVLIILSVLFIPKLIRPKGQLEKSIAILPFINDSPVDSNKYFINGIMEEVLNNLQKIKAFRVLSRTSTDQFKGPDRPTITEIAKKLDVNYVVEGSGQKYGNSFRLRVQLIMAKGKETHIWGKTYEQKIRETTDLFSLQSQIAQAIAVELKAEITPEEKHLIEKVHTANLTAYDLYLKATSYDNDYQKTRDLSSYQTAVNLYKAALETDTTFARAYTGLANVYFTRYYGETYFKENFMDTCLVLVNKALTFDNRLDQAYRIKGLYYLENGDIEAALANFDIALKINPNYEAVYVNKGYILGLMSSDFVKCIDNYQKALSLISGDERPTLLRCLGEAYLNCGFIEKAKYYYKEAFVLDSNEVFNLSYLSWLEHSIENFEEALKLQKMAEEIDSTAYTDLITYSLPPGHNEEAYRHANKLIRYFNKPGMIDLYNSYRIGYAFWQVGKEKEAKNYFNQQIKYDEECIKLDRPVAKWKAAHYDLAATYAFLGDKKKAYRYLDEWDTRKTYPLWWISLAKNDPLFASIRNEERFQKILQNAEAKFRVEHERVGTWLEEQGML
jgi:TolB-like protein/Tfp pilus assembly protein PilF